VRGVTCPGAPPPYLVGATGRTLAMIRVWTALLLASGLLVAGCTVEFANTQPTVSRQEKYGP